jgi:hypothetical protein
VYLILVKTAVPHSDETEWGTAVFEKDDGKSFSILKIVSQAEGEVLLELKIAESRIVILLATVIVESPKGIYLGGNILVELERKDVFHLGFNILVGGEVVATTLPNEVLHYLNLRFEFDFGTEVLLEVLIDHIVGRVDSFVGGTDIAHLV